MSNISVEAREKLHLSQQELGRLLGLHEMTISRWERGTITPDGRALSILENILKLPDDKVEALSAGIHRDLRAQGLAAMCRLLAAIKPQLEK